MKDNPLYILLLGFLAAQSVATTCSVKTIERIVKERLEDAARTAAPAMERHEPHQQE